MTLKQFFTAFGYYGSNIVQQANLKEILT